MKEQDYILTLEETEQLCRLYMDCGLSVFEETELRYFLTRVDYHSPLIDDVRRIMEIEVHTVGKNVIEARSVRKSKLHKWVAYSGIAASVALVIGVGLLFLKTSSVNSVESQSYYVAYVGGHRLSEEEARMQIEAEKKSADDFIKKMSELEASKQQMIDNFFNP